MQFTCSVLLSYINYRSDRRDFSSMNWLFWLRHHSCSRWPLHRSESSFVKQILLLHSYIKDQASINIFANKLSCILASPHKNDFCNSSMGFASIYSNEKYDSQGYIETWKARGNEILIKKIWKCEMGPWVGNYLFLNCQTRHIEINDFQLCYNC